ncbi:MAG: NAD-dependent epimerase/dehydratase family protein [Candidatus Binatia bacterium]
MARVLVTGGSGFIGTALTPALLRAGHVPRLLVRTLPVPTPAAPVEIVRGDLLDAASLDAAVRGCDAVVHLGAATSGGRMDAALGYRVNVGGTTALIAACRRAGCRRVIVMSTQHVHLPRPGLYGRTKRIADELFLASGLDVTILRPSLVYGPGTRGVFTKLAGLVRQLPIVPIIGKGTWHLRPVYLDDLVAVVLETLARPELAARTYDVGGPDRVTYTEFVAAICVALGKRFRRIHLPLGLSFVLAWVLERLLPSPPLTTENVRGATLEAPCDLRLLCGDFHVRLTPLAEGLAQVARSTGR